MTRFNHIRQAKHGILGQSVWSISEPDRFDRVKLQVTCQSVSLESDWIHLVDAKATKQGMEKMLTEILFTDRPFIIRRKAS